MASDDKDRKMRFERLGRAYHLRIRTAGDLRSVLELDEAHWVATNAPISKINCDGTFLKLVDFDANGRITCREVKRAIRWLLEVLSDTSGVSDGSGVLRPEAINTACEDGKAIHATAVSVLDALGKADSHGLVRSDLRLAEVKADPEQIKAVEKLILYQAHMLELANNFVSFPHLYDPAARAMFETGSLLMDGRRFNLSVGVDDHQKHVEVARSSNMFLLYVQVCPPGEAAAYQVAVPVTSGGKGNLCVGKRGIFTDLAGVECDAVVLGIIENPISLGEAIVSPFVRLAAALTGKIESLTERAEKRLDAGVTIAAPIGDGAAAGAGSRFAAGGMLMGAGVAVAALGSALAYITKTLAQTHWLAIVIGVLGAVVAVMLPTVIIAFLKLRRRDLSAILEGSGWAINARMRLTRAQGRCFTQRPVYPAGARGVPGIRWRWLIAAGILAALAAGAWKLWDVHRTPACPASRSAVHPDGGSQRFSILPILRDSSPKAGYSRL